ncbi:MAG: GDSL-type esterase/lipase family protein [Acidimicrobiales bacterium]
MRVRITLIATASISITVLLLVLSLLANAPAAADQLAPSSPFAWGSTTLAPVPATDLAAPQSRLPAIDPINAVAPNVATDPSDVVAAETQPSPLQPPKVLVVGDSITQSAQVEITTALGPHTEELVIMAWGGTAPCDWVGPVAETVADFDPDIVIIEFAGNDLTPCIVSTPRGSDGYLARYSEDARALTTAAAANGAAVHWASVPVMADTVYDAVTGELNQIYRELSHTRTLIPVRDSVAVDGALSFTDTCRSADECGDAPIGSTVAIRADDGLHLTPSGSARLAATYAEVIATVGAI